MNNIIHNIKEEFSRSTVLNRIIYLNIISFLILSLINIFSFLFQININPIIEKLSLPASKDILISQPWALLSYMFLHTNLLHLAFNMLLLHIGGKIFSQHLNSKQLLSTYILGGICGALFVIILYNYVPFFEVSKDKVHVVGSSASVLAIFIAIATYKPNYNIYLPFLNYTKLKYIAIIFIILDIISIPHGNTGGHIAHLGGAIFGYTYIKQLKIKKNKFKSFTRKIFSYKKRRSETDYDFNRRKILKQKEIDIILEKISKSGYESLNNKEKQLLFSESKK